MTIKQIDFIFPFVILAYGFLITFVLSWPRLVVLAEERLPAPLLKQLMAHRALALVCLLVGGLWSLQNIWVGQNIF